MKNALIAALVLFSLAACRKDRRSRDACILLSKASVNISESVTVNNCGDELPTQYIDLSIDWGDGTTSNGQIGSHEYTMAGTYQVRLMINGEFAADVIDADESDVSKSITVVE